MLAFARDVAAWGGKLPLRPSRKVAVRQLVGSDIVCVSELLGQIRDFYPNFDAWLARKVYPGCAIGTRAVFATSDGVCGKPRAVLIAKRELFERKICTLFVDPKYAYQGDGKLLMTHAVAWLDDRRPIITVGEARLAAFEGLFASFGFELTGSVVGLYRSGDVEHVFNDRARSMLGGC